MNGVESDDFTRKMETQHLLLSLMVDDVTLETPRTDRCDRAELVASPEQVLSRLYWSRTVDDLLEPLGFVSRQAPGEAKLAQRAAAAGNLGAGGFAAVIANVGDS
jgi:hypothetical protein